MKLKLIDFCDWQLKSRNNSLLWFSCPSGFMGDIATSVSASVQNPSGVQELRVCNKAIKLSPAQIVVWIQPASFLQLHRNKLTFQQDNQSLENGRVVIEKIVSSNPSSCSHRGKDNGGPHFIGFFFISLPIFRTMLHRKRPHLPTLPNYGSCRSYKKIHDM